MIQLVPGGPCKHHGRQLLVSLLLLVTATLWGTTLTAEGTAGTLYTAALVRERSLREPGVQPSLNDLRSTISGYEEIVRRFPRSSFDDHSLWQGAGLALMAYEQYRQQQDVETGVRLLRLLSVNHPTSAFSGRVPTRLRRLNALTKMAKLTEINREPLPDVVRITMTLDREVLFHSDHLSNPSRWFFDLRGTQAAPELRNSRLTFTEDDDVVRAVRLGRHPNQVTRVVLDAENTDGCHAFTLYEPFRVVVDCRRTSLAADFVVASTTGSLTTSALPVDLPQQIVRVVAPVSPPTTAATSLLAMLEEPTPSFKKLDSLPTTESAQLSNTANTYSVARQLGLGISRVVIDAGHGGRDPGTAGLGITEADIVLDLALRLEQRLHSVEPELEVVLTRRADDYLPLEARTALANQVGADLFLSIHANASEDARARGIETYYLDFSVDQEAAALAARENIGSLGTMNHLDDLLQAIASNSKLDESRELAETVQQTMLHTLRSIDPEIPDLGVKRAPFVVLIGARMPSVLAEVSFLTNSKDATMLSTDAYRDLIVDALLAAIQQYQQSLRAEQVLALADVGDF